MIIQATALLIIFFAVGSGHIFLYVVCVVIAGTALGGMGILKFSMMADVADVEQLRANGLRDEGKLVGLFDISSKICASVLLAVGFQLIEASGYEADTVPQNEETRRTLIFSRQHNVECLLLSWP